MPSASEFSTDPDANITIGGKYVGENCAPDVINNAIRYLAAVARDSYNQLPAPGEYLPITGGTLTGNISRAGAGVYLHHADPSLSDGRTYFLPEGSARPAPAPGIVVYYYS